MSRHGKTFLHVNGDSVKDAGRMSLGQRLVGLLCGSQCVFAKLIGKRVQLRVVPVDAFKDPWLEADAPATAHQFTETLPIVQ